MVSGFIAKCKQNKARTINKAQTIEEEKHARQRQRISEMVFKAAVKAPELEPLEDVPPEKTRLYSNLSTEWPIRPSMYFMKQCSRIIERRAQSVRLAHRDMVHIAEKMMKKHPEGGYDVASCKAHWAKVRETATTVRRATHEGCTIDEENGLLILPTQRRIKAWPTWLRHKTVSLSAKNLLDVFKYLEMSDTYGHNAKLVLSDEEEEKHEETHEQTQPVEPEVEYGDESEYEIIYDEEQDQGHKAGFKSINLILPVAKDDKTGTFNVKKFSAIAEKDQDERPTKRVKMNSGKAFELKQALVRVKGSSGKTEVTCTHCKNNRLGCTRDIPRCSSCQYHGVECSYPGITIIKKKSSRKSKHKPGLGNSPYHRHGMQSVTPDTSESDSRFPSNHPKYNGHPQAHYQPGPPFVRGDPSVPLYPPQQQNYPPQQQNYHPQGHYPQPPPHQPYAYNAPPQQQHIPPPPPQHQFQSQQLVRLPPPQLQMFGPLPPPPPRVPLVLPPEEIERRRKSVASMIKLYGMGHFNDVQLLDFARDMVTLDYVEDFNLFKGAPDRLLAQILKDSVRV